MTTPLTLILIDDDAISRRAIRLLLEKEKNISLIIEAESAEQAFNLLAQYASTIALVDFHLGGKGSEGPRLIHELKKNYPQLHCISLTIETNPFLLLQLIDAGTDAIIRKSGIDLLIRTITTVANGGHIVQPEIGFELIQATKERGCLSFLSKSEYQYFQLIGQGHPDTWIAKKLHTPLSTLRSRCISIKRKLHQFTKADLIMLYQRFFPQHDSHFFKQTQKKKGWCPGKNG